MLRTEDRKNKFFKAELRKIKLKIINSPSKLLFPPSLPNPQLIPVLFRTEVFNDNTKEDMSGHKHKT